MSNLKSQNQENNENKIVRPPDDFWMDKQEVMERMHISGRTLQTWRSKGILPYKKIGRRIFYWESDLRKLMHP